jgi:polyisoprenoid-binding protein YceI
MVVTHRSVLQIHRNYDEGIMKRLVSLAVLVLLAVSAFAQGVVWKSDKPHSRATFFVTYMLISEVEGRFTDFEATLTQGGEDFSGSTVEATIKTASVNTNNDSRDKHLRSDDFFNAEKFPTITFKSTSFEKTGDKTYVVKGDLTMRDVTKPVELATTMAGPIKDPYGKTRVAFEATTTLKRFDYGVRWSNSLDTGGLTVSNEVKVDLVFQFVK